MTRRALITVVVLLVVAAPARPVAADDYGPRNAVSVMVPSLFGRGLAVEVERFALPRRWSFAGAVGARMAGGGDYGSLTVAAGGEARFWLVGRAPFSRPGRRAMVGPYLGARVEVSRMGLRDHARDRHAGTSVTVAEGLLFGYRFTFGRKVEVTPSLGVIVKTEWDPSGRLAAWTTGTAVVGLTAGVLF